MQLGQAAGEGEQEQRAEYHAVDESPEFAAREFHSATPVHGRTSDVSQYAPG
jgi:hypothetical protein